MERVAILWLASSLALGACGDASDNAGPVEHCDALVSTLCMKIFQCGAGSAFKSEAECETKQRDRLACAQWTLPTGCTFDWGPFNRCLVDVGHESCAAAQGGPPASCQTAAAGPPNCPGAVFCSSHSSSSSGASCSDALSSCTDGKSYTLSCDQNGACTCQVNGAVTQPAAGLTQCTQDEAVLNKACGWMLAVRPHAPPPDLAMPDLVVPPDFPPGCVIDGSWVAPGAQNPMSSCQTCDPSSSMNGWTNLPDTTSCGGGCGTCSSGTCGPVVVASGQFSTAIVADASDVYFVDGGALKRVPVGGGTPVQLAPTARGIALDRAYVYFTTGTSVMKVALAGGALSTLAANQNGATAIAVDATSVYWVNESDGSVMKMALAGGAPVALASGQTGAHAIAVDATSVYFTLAQGSVMKVGIGGGAPVLLGTMGGSPQALVVDGQNAYWTRDGAVNGSVLRVPIGGGSPVTLVSMLIKPMGIALDGGYVYWADQTGLADNVAKVPTGGGRAVPIAGMQSYPVGVAVGASCVYFTTESGVLKAPK